MARARTTSDVFNAIAEPRRREIIEFLADGQARAVNELVDRLSVTLAGTALWTHSLVLAAAALGHMRAVESGRRIQRALVNKVPLESVFAGCSPTVP